MSRPRSRTSATTCRCRRREGSHHIDGREVGGYLVPGGGPMPIATFRNGDIVDITLQHWAGRDGCRVPAEHLTPREWLES